VLAALRAGHGVAARRAIEADIEETTGQLLKRAIFADDADAVDAGGRLSVVARVDESGG
jgi:hypothetical protein